MLNFDLCQRPRNAAATRGEILDAASRRFMGDSYDQVGMRDIAKDVGVDPALISRYFGSKEDLFRAVIDNCGSGSDFMEGDRATFGARMAHDLVYGPRKEGKWAMLLVMLRSASSPKGLEVIQRASREGFYQPFVEWIGGEHANVRARLAAGLMMGLSVSRDLVHGQELPSDEAEVLCVRLAALLQDLIDG